MFEVSKHERLFPCCPFSAYSSLKLCFRFEFRVEGEVVMAIGNVEVCFRIRAIAKFSYLVAKLRIHGLFPKVLSWPL